jgi:hypothetical protein
MPRIARKMGGEWLGRGYRDSPKCLVKIALRDSIRREIVPEKPKVGAHVLERREDESTPFQGRDTVHPDAKKHNQLPTVAYADRRHAVARRISSGLTHCFR